MSEYPDIDPHDAAYLEEEARKDRDRKTTDPTKPELLSAEERNTLVEKAHRYIGELCRHEREWRMSVPARPDEDVDLVISGALHELVRTLDTRDAEIERWQAACDERRYRARDAIATLREAVKLRPGCDRVEHAAEDAAAEIERLREAMRKAIQLVDVARDWNLDEVEIDEEMVSTLDLKAEVRAALREEGT